MLIWPTPRVAWSLAALFDCWYFQLSSTLTPSAGGGGKGSPSSPGKKNKKTYYHGTLYVKTDVLAIIYGST